ncbi:hypothetical protein GCK72_016626 [Caenorhabditis remanei]|uniref:Ubiquitin carboxyl-terminal hydrolase 7 n=1 Tax=Caenorhabditis remanei TaxID=31234 RepID=A0A6A5G554_CAERE|nr:hypothetical protein GCK72_016626 [Caenorhabditis remanei]KAF1750080.1 hypothetical protein GCK72_016626 [Caenorhabditis remanei]
MCSPDPDDMVVMPTHDIPAYDECNDPYGPEGHLSLDIDCFSAFMNRPDNRMMSKPVIVRGIPWRILAICRSQQGGRHTISSRVSRNNYNFGFFLQCNNDELLQKRGIWRCYGQATLEVLNTKGASIQKKIHHSFHNGEVDWGFSNYDQYDTLMNPKDGYVVNDTIKLRCRFTADVPSGAGYLWDSKRHTGCIGLRNQGATCYMNSILQSFYFTTGFRRAVYKMEVGTEPSESNIVLAMQRVFYELQMSSEAVETNSLTRAFGWDKLDAFNQHDVQEFCRVLLDNLETKMKGSSEEKSIPNLFRGNMKSYIKCLDVDYESSRTESFYDVQLNVLGMDSLERAFQAYTTSETLDDENKYDAGDHGLQRAEKGVKFVELPPVLHVQLMRFQYCGVEQKINERFSFPEKMNLAECCELGPLLTEEDCVYSLHAVLVHSGEFHGGHYVTFINVNLHESAVDPTATAKWCKFDDDVVSRTTTDDAIVSNFGGEKAMNTSAYMLVYVRDNAIEQVLAPIPDTQIPQSVSRTFELERMTRNREKKKMEEEQLCMTVALVTPDIVATNHTYDLVEQTIINEVIPHETVWKHMMTAELYLFVNDKLFQKSDLPKVDMFDNDDHAMELRHRVIRQIKSKKFNFRLWRMSDAYPMEKSQKQPSRLRPTEFIECSGDMRLDSILSSEFEVLYVEFSNNKDRPLNDYLTTRDILFFIKYYDAITHKFNIITHTMLDCHKRVSLYRSHLCEILGLPTDTELKYYIEHSPMTVEYIDETNKNTLGRLVEDQDGSILIVEKAATSTPINNAKVKMSELYLRVEFEFHQAFHNKKVEEEPIEPFLLKFSLDQPLTDAAKEVAARHDVDHRRILFWTRMSGNRQEACFDDYSIHQCRQLMNRQIHDPRIMKVYRVQYIIMPFDVEEVSKTRMQCRLYWQLPNGHVEEATLFPPKEGTVADLLEEAERYYPYAEGGSRKFRLLQIGNSPLNNQRVYQIYNENLALADVDQRTMYKMNIQQALHARIEEIPLDELEITPGDFFCPVVHFEREPTKLFGVSFVIKIRNGELMTEVRDRLRRKLPDVTDAEFAKYKFALLSRDKLCRNIEFNVGEKVNLTDMANQTTGVPQVYIGLDHKAPSQHSNEAAIRILN